MDNLLYVYQEIYCGYCKEKIVFRSKNNGPWICIICKGDLKIMQDEPRGFQEPIDAAIE